MFSAMIVLATSFAASAQNTSSYAATLNKLMDVSGSRQVFKAAIVQMMTMVKSQQTNVPEEFWKEMESELSKMSGDDLVAMLVPIYQKHMTEADLKSVIAFYESPAGRRYAEKTPLITQESMAAGQEWGKKIGEALVKKMKEKGHMN